MPKEVIRSTDMSSKLEVDEETGTVSGSIERSPMQAELGWSREAEYVQLGTVTTDESVEWDERGYFVQLDREGINRLIRSLRRARDQVFGKDA